MTVEELNEVGNDIMRPPRSMDAVTWLAENVKRIPGGVFDGGYDPARWPWIAESIRIFNEPTTSRMFLPWAIGCGKTLTLRMCATYLMANKRSKMAIYMQSQDKASEFTMKELRPVFDLIPAIRGAMSPLDAERSEIVDFSDGSAIYNRSAGTKADLQSIHVRYVLGSECWLWPNGAIYESLARMKAASFASKGLFESQPGEIDGKGHEFWQYYLMSDQREWHFACPECCHKQPWLWDYIRFPDDARRTDGWDTLAVQQGTTYECSSCRTRLPDTSSVRVEANKVDRGAGFVATTKPEKAGFVGLHVNALASTRWGDLAVDMIKAKRSFDDFGDTEGRKIFKQKYLALPWADESGMMVASTESGDYCDDDDWDALAAITTTRPVRVIDAKDAPDGSVPFVAMLVDCQGDHFWVVIRQFSKTGHSRRKFFGKVSSNTGISDWSGLDTLAAKYRINPHLVRVDAGDGNSSSEVYKQCAHRKWQCLKGSGQEFFTVKGEGGHPIRRFYAEPTVISVPGVGTTTLTLWSNLSGKDMFYGLRARKVFTYPRDASDDYIAQLDAEVRTKEKGRPIWKLRQGVRDNHAFDCELLGLVLAAQWGILGRDGSVSSDDDESPNSAQ